MTDHIHLKGWIYINRSVTMAMSALRDAADDPSSYVAHDVAMIRRCVLGLEQVRVVSSLKEFETIMKYYDMSFDNLRLSGYLVSEDRT